MRLHHKPLPALDYPQRLCCSAFAVFLGENFIVEGETKDEARGNEAENDDYDDGHVSPPKPANRGG